MSRRRREIRIEGTVQGVGFRPFVYRLATEHGLAGWILNDSQGVLLQVEGGSIQLDEFAVALRSELPPLARISRLHSTDLPPENVSGFAIVASQRGEVQSAQISPDCHVCPDCLRELFDPQDRRYNYPFINCTNCGPRYSIISGVPYDRPLTTMADFPMCAACRAEYDDPASRRFHAQPNACPVCGPQLQLHGPDGACIESATPLRDAVDCLQRGEILALKGLGGYHLAVDPANPRAVERLRRRKHRDEKPFALMARDLDAILDFAQPGSVESRLLESVERPIVLLEKNGVVRGICDGVAPRNRYLGVMLPYTPLHYLLLEHFPALVMTSGNQSDEPIAFDDEDAFERLRGIADLFLCHNRRIHVRTDDSIVRVLREEPLMLRRSRGYVPRAIKLGAEQPAVLALGAELKNTICLTSGERATLSQHIGDLKNVPVIAAVEQAIGHLRRLLDVNPALVVHDQHPDYASTRLAQRMNETPRLAVQHHHAHLASCLADNGADGRTIGVIFDGIGYGSDGHIWGGEFLLGDFVGFERVGHLMELRMPGGDVATREPWRMGLSLLYSTFGRDLPDLEVVSGLPDADRRLLLQMLDKGVNSPWTSSCGRLFDAVAALAGVRQRVSYEGQAALELEMSLEDGESTLPYVFELNEAKGRILVDPRPMVRQLVTDLRQGRAPGAISAAFHNGLAAAIVAVCCRLREREGALPVALSGGVFQNAYLAARTERTLETAGFHVLVHRQVPPNDGGLALGQAVIGGAYLRTSNRAGA